MVKRLALILVALSWISPFSVYALGLGSIDMRSTLNQRLDARIELMRVRGDELNGLEVSLAPADIFRRAGIDRPSFLTQIKFELVTPASDGTPYIHLSSSKPITEPFLNFLIEVNWSNGRLLREFTVLVDPPVLADEREQKSIQAPVSAPAPVEQQRTPARTARAVPPQQQRTTRSVPPRVSTPEPEFLETASGDAEYGPVKRGDTLWDIANKMRTDSSVSVPQMMIALLESNPRAFFDNNINNLKMGHVLRLSDADSAISISSGEAARMASLQWDEWKEAKGLTLGSTPSRTRTASNQVERDARVKLVSPGEGEEDGTGTPRSVAAGSSVARLNEELSLSQEALDATRQETKEISSRLDSLKGQMETMKRLVNLKDNQLVALQNQLKEAGETPELKDSAESQVLAEELSSAESELTAEQLATEIGEISTDEQSEMEAILSGEGGESQVISAEQLAAEEAAAQADRSAEAAAGSGIAASLMALPGKIMGDFKLLGGVVVVFLVLGGFAWLVVRRRNLRQFQESILTGQSSIGDIEAISESPSEDASFMSDFAVSSMEGVQTDVSEVDPISEADVYLAYGRYKQAEELISSAIQSDPERADLKLKSLEIHYAAKDEEAFELQAEMHKDALRETEHWARVTEMGRELCPENAMFFADTGSSALETSMDDAVDVGSVDFGDGEFASNEFADLGVDNLGTHDNASAEQVVDNFDLGDVDDTDKTQIVGKPEPEIEENSLDFDLGDFDTGGGASGGTEQMDVISEMSEEESSLEDNSFDFDLGSFETDDLTAAADDDERIASTAESAGDNSLDFDLSLDDSPVSAGEEEEVSMEITEDDMDAELDDSLFADVDEVGTKLDLAKAYIDMGDSDGAKSILDEVLEEGDDSQKNEAEGLMAQMA